MVKVDFSLLIRKFSDVLSDYSQNTDLEYLIFRRFRFDPQEVIEDTFDAGTATLMMAQHIFTECGDPADCIVQNMGHDCIVFGGGNRVYLTSEGWKVSEYYCHQTFIDAFVSKGFGEIQ